MTVDAAQPVSAPPVVTASGVTKRHGGRAVLRGVDLVVRPGEVVGVLGANGTGKSTLLRVLAGVSRPSAGAVRTVPRVGHVPDRFPAQQRMSARAYLRHLGRISGLTRSDADERAARWCERFGLAGGPDTPLRDLSKGNAQKVALAQALLAEPELLVLDETWSGLDAETRPVLSEVIAEVAADGAAVVFTDHRPELVRATATRSYRLTGGRLAELGAGLALCRIVLHGGRDADWAAHDGVVGVRRGRNVELDVDLARREVVLAEAIRSGCAVIAVDSSGGSR